MGAGEGEGPDNTHPNAERCATKPSDVTSIEEASRKCTSHILGQPKLCMPACTCMSPKSSGVLFARVNVPKSCNDTVTVLLPAFVVRKMFSSPSF